jgi:hypothetical protein
MSREHRLPDSAPPRARARSFAARGKTPPRACNSARWPEPVRARSPPPCSGASAARRQPVPWSLAEIPRKMKNLAIFQNAPASPLAGFDFSPPLKTRFEGEAMLQGHAARGNRPSDARPGKTTATTSLDPMTQSGNPPSPAPATRPCDWSQPLILTHAAMVCVALSAWHVAGLVAALVWAITAITLEIRKRNRA